jgi:hypothetical protein
VAGYLPKEWNGKRVSVRFGGGQGFDAKLIDDNAGGIFVEPIEEVNEEEKTQSAFVPWAAMRFVRLMEEPDKRRRPRSKATAAEMPEDPAP